MFDVWLFKRRVLKQIKEIKKLLNIAKKRKKSKHDVQLKQINETIKQIKILLNQPQLNIKKINQYLEQLESYKKSVLREYKREAFIRELLSIALVILLALSVRAFLLEAFKIPTGSMIPTLQISDFLFVNKIQYGIRIPFTNKYIIRWNYPKRGEVVTFEFPYEGEDKGKEFIKRVIGVEGDRIKIKDNIIYINDKPVKTIPLFKHINCMDTRSECKCDVQLEQIGDYTFISQHHSSQNCLNLKDWPLEFMANERYLKKLKNAGIYVQVPSDFIIPERLRNYIKQEKNGDFYVEVPKGYIFVMGDNRDNSYDSRFWGFVPKDIVRGKGFIIWFAKDFKRIFKFIH